MVLPTNTAFAIATSLTGRRIDPHMSYNFVLEVGGLLTGGFTNVSGLESEIQLESYQEGGVNGYTHQFPSQIVYPNLVLTHGLIDLPTLWDWYWATTEGVIIRLNGTIMLLDHERLPVMWWNFKDAYPVKWVGPQLDASNSTEVAIERLELVHRGITQPILSQALSAVRFGAALAGKPINTKNLKIH